MLHSFVELFTYFDIGKYRLYCAIKAETGAVQRQVVILGVFPFLAGVILVVVGTVFVGLSNELLNVRDRKTVDLHCFLQTKIFGRVDKDTDNAWNICKDMVGAASDDNAGAFLCELADDFCLIAKKVVILCKTCAFFSHPETEWDECRFLRKRAK